MKTHGDHWKEQAEKGAIPLRNLAQVKAAIMEATVTKADISLARLMLNHGRLTQDARDWLLKEYPQ